MNENEINWEIKSFNLAESFRKQGDNAPEFSCSKFRSVKEILLFQKNSLKEKGTNSRQFIHRL